MATAGEGTPGARKSTWRRLTHRYTWAIVLIALLIITLLTAAVIPQTGQVTASHLENWQADHPTLNAIGNALGLNDLVTSWWVLVLALLIALLLAYDFTLRLRGITRSGKKLSKQAFKTRMGIYGSLFFHLCLITIFLGAVIDLTFGFHGTIFLTEGQAEHESPATYAYVKNGLIGDRAHKGFTFRLIRYDPAYGGHGMTAPAALMRFYLDGNVAGEQWISVNHPASVSGVRVYLRDEVGYTPYFEIYDTAGTPQYRSFVRLAAQRTDGGIVHGDYIPQPGDRHLYCAVHPDSGDTLQLAFSEREGEPVTAYLTPPGTTTVDDLHVYVREVRRWVRFEFSCHPGEPVVFAGIWGAILGLAWRFAFPQPRLEGTGR